MRDRYLFMKGFINSRNVVLGLSTAGQLANDPLDKRASLDKNLCHTLACSSGLTDYIGLVFQYITIFTKTYKHIFLACYWLLLIIVAYYYGYHSKMSTTYSNQETQGCHSEKLCVQQDCKKAVSN